MQAYGVLKYPIAHGDNGTGMCKAESAGDDWLSDELQIDPIIDEPREMTSPPVLGADELRARASHVTVVFTRHTATSYRLRWSSRLNFCHKTTFHIISYVLEQFGTGKPCVICQDKTRLVESPLKVGIGARCVRAEGSRSLA